MKSHGLRNFLFISLFLVFSPYAYSSAEMPLGLRNESELDIFSFYTTLSHTEGKGIGYKQGYTTLEFFLMPSFWESNGLYPFIDLRAHGLDNQRIAANAGIGLRCWLTDDWLTGINVYYDYRQGQHHGYDKLGYGFQQVGFGLEALGPYVDVRFNLYQPVGKKVSNFTQIYLDQTGIIPTIIGKSQWALRGFDAEIGGTIACGRINCCDWEWGSYLAAGPYYLHQECSSGDWGGKGRLELYLGRYLFIKGAAGYDNHTRGTAQICVGIEIPLYPFTSSKPAEAYYAPDEVDQYAKWHKWVSQPTERVEIMPLRSRHIPESK